jgi:hypothetical protein
MKWYWLSLNNSKIVTENGSMKSNNNNNINCNHRSKQGRIGSLIKDKKLLKIFFFFLGLFSFIWIISRVILKPSRATYPCVQTAYPFASGFLLYIAGLLTSTYAYTRALSNFRKRQYAALFTLLIVAIGASSLVSIETKSSYAQSSETEEFEKNSPMGKARGIIPGRVTWAYDPNATNENAEAEDWINNTNLKAVENMVKNSITSLTGKDDLKESWNELFKYFNIEHGKGAVGYKDGEKIFIKLNLTNTILCDQNYNDNRIHVVRTTPEITLVILRHLVNELKIPQEKISVGDPQHCIVNQWWDVLHPEFPDVKYIDNRGEKGRTLAVKGTNVDIKYSDRGKILRSGGPDFKLPNNTNDPVYQDSFYKVIEEADYIINLAALKAHESAGITLCAKNHFGSQTRKTSIHLHRGLVRPGARNDSTIREGYRQYRVLVDLMGNKYLGGNTLLFVVDGLWAGPNSGGQPDKFDMSPFNGDWTSSIFMSQDQVALESVCFDFLRTEYTKGSNHRTSHPQMNGVDDYLRQAADPANWPKDIVYDPEDDGIPLKSLGVHEHWNNPIDKQYSRNLGKNVGIDLHRVK